MNYTKIRENASQFKALTSLCVEDFDALLCLFEPIWEAYIYKFKLDGTPRVRKYSPKSEKDLPSCTEKLFFILYYEKNNPLQEALAASFDLKQDMANKWVHVLSPLLTKALKNFVPTRNPLQLEHQLIENQVYIADATERPIQRDTYDQKNFYSGKKKTHTIKNLLLTTSLGLILFLSQTVSGKVHDKKLAEELSIHKLVKILADLGFIGIESINSQLELPHKKPRNQELTKLQKRENKIHSSKRVSVEHTIGHLKTMRIVKDENRNYKFGYRDLIMVNACALHNFRLLKRIARTSIRL